MAEINIEREPFYASVESHFADLMQPLEVRYIEVLTAAHILATTLKDLVSHGLPEGTVTSQFRDSVGHVELSEVNDEADNLHFSRGLLELAKLRGLNMALDSVLNQSNASAVRRSLHG